MLEPLPLFVGGLPGGPELLVVLLVVVLLFGAQKLPRLARSTGEAMGEFQKGREEIEGELEELREAGSEAGEAPGTDHSRTAAETGAE
jgi:sec-independent protein translocase protein TatA